MPQPLALKDPQLEARIQSLEIAYRMQFEAQEAFDVSRETQSTLDDYGKGEFANGARRICEGSVERAMSPLGLARKLRNGLLSAGRII